MVEIPSTPVRWTVWCDPVSCKGHPGQTRIYTSVCLQPERPLCWTTNIMNHPKYMVFFYQKRGLIGSGYVKTIVYYTIYIYYIFFCCILLYYILYIVNYIYRVPIYIYRKLYCYIYICWPRHTQVRWRLLWIKSDPRGLASNLGLRRLSLDSDCVVHSPTRGSNFKLDPITGIAWWYNVVHPPPPRGPTRLPGLRGLCGSVEFMEREGISTRAGISTSVRHRRGELLSSGTMRTWEFFQLIPGTSFGAPKIPNLAHLRFVKKRVRDQTNTSGLNVSTKYSSRALVA